MKKDDIDEFVPDENSLIPYSQFMAKYSGNVTVTDTVPALECEVDLVGTKEPCKVAIDISPSPQGRQKKTLPPSSPPLSLSPPSLFLRI